jgi:hypothetical protein
MKFTIILISMLVLVSLSCGADGREGYAKAEFIDRPGCK